MVAIESVDSTGLADRRRASGGERRGCWWAFFDSALLNKIIKFSKQVFVDCYCFFGCVRVCFCWGFRKVSWWFHGGFKGFLEFRLLG